LGQLDTEPPVIEMPELVNLLVGRVGKRSGVHVPSMAGRGRGPAPCVGRKAIPGPIEVSVRPILLCVKKRANRIIVIPRLDASLRQA